jgi:hypothetical protein
MAITLGGLAVYIAVSYSLLFLVAAYLVYHKRSPQPAPEPPDGCQKVVTALKWVFTMAVLVVAPLYYLMQMNTQFADLFDAFDKLDTASHVVRDAFDSDADSLCKNITGIEGEIGKVLVGALFDAEYGYIIDILSYLNVLVASFWGVGALVLAGPHIVAFVIWCNPKQYSAIFIMLIFLSFQIVFPGIVSMALTMLYYKYAPDISSADTSITQILRDVHSSCVAECASNQCQHAQTFIALLENLFSKALNPSLACERLLEKELCIVKAQLTQVNTDGDDLDLTVLYYNYIAIGCVVFFIIAASQLLINRSLSEKVVAAASPFAYTRLGLKETFF